MYLCTSARLWTIGPGLRLARKNLQTIMMYYWIVKHDGSEDQDIISYREDFGTLRQHHILVESLSPPLKAASFVLGRRINTEKTWRDLNDTLVTCLQSQLIQDNKGQSPLGVNIGANDPAMPRVISTDKFLQGQLWLSRTQYHKVRRQHSPSRAGECFKLPLLCCTAGCTGLLRRIGKFSLRACHEFIPPDLSQERAF